MSVEVVPRRSGKERVAQEFKEWGSGKVVGVATGGKPISLSEIKARLHELKRVFRCFSYRYEYAQDAFHLVLEFRSNECARIVLAELLRRNVDADVAELRELPFGVKLAVFRALVDRIRGFKESLKPMDEGMYMYSGKYVNAVLSEFMPKPLALRYDYERWYLHIKSIDMRIPFGAKREEAFKELSTIYDYLNTCYIFASLYYDVMEKEFRCRCEACGNVWIEKFKEAYSTEITCPRCKHTHYIYSNPDDFFLYCEPS